MIGTADGATSTKLLITNFQIDRMGNVFFAGTTTSAFGPNGCRIRPDTRKDIDVVVCKLGGALVYRWCKAIGGGYADRPAVVGGTGIAFDAHGNTFIAGTTSGALPGKRSLGGMDAFVAKLDANGNVNWTSQIGSGGADTAVAISVDTYSDMIYVSGNTNGLIDQKRGGMDWFTFQLRSINGSTVWKRQYGGPGDDLMTDMVVYHQRVFYVGTLPVASGDWTPYWKDNGNATHYHNAINSGVRTWYNGYLRGGRDVVVCELAQVGDEAKPSRDWTFVPVASFEMRSSFHAYLTVVLSFTFTGHAEVVLSIRLHG